MSGFPYRIGYSESMNGNKETLGSVSLFFGRPNELTGPVPTSGYPAGSPGIQPGFPRDPRRDFSHLNPFFHGIWPFLWGRVRTSIGTSPRFPLAVMAPAGYNTAAGVGRRGTPQSKLLNPQVRNLPATPTSFRSAYLFKKDVQQRWNKEQ